MTHMSSRCWVWLACTTNGGYGKLGWNDKTERAHRVSWFLYHGEFPEVCLLHKCDNPACVRPAHLFEGTRTENAHDRDRKGRTSKGDRHWAYKTGKYRRMTLVRARQLIARSTAGESYRNLAASFGISRAAVYDIMVGKTYIVPDQGDLVQ
jgi:hypothetical protein